jgi:hypothetical protein
MHTHTVLGKYNIHLLGNNVRGPVRLSAPKAWTHQSPAVRPRQYHYLLELGP